MKPSVRQKLDQIVSRHEEVGLLMADPDVVGDRERFTALSKEYAQLEDIVRSVADYDASHEQLADAEAMFDESDPELRALARDEADTARERLAVLERELEVHLLPRDPRDDSNIFLEVRAGTGGDEAALFAGDVFRMYARYAESRGWQVELLSESAGEHGGYKEVVARMSGQGVFSRLKFESGAHRVQRVPETESQGRIHTSACTVAVLPELEEVESVEIDTGDLRIDTYRSSGAGGQHVNTTDSAIRITHLPSGIVVECQDERSQHKNKARAMSLLRARLLEAEQQRQAAEISAERKLQVGSGDRSQRIRTYNFPQGRITDHRIGLTLYKLDELLGGQLDMIIDPLIQEHQAEELAALAATPA